MSDTREQLAAYAHEAWAGWMKYLFEKGCSNNDGSFTIYPANVERWLRQMNTDYAELPETERESDRDEADKMLAIVEFELAALRVAIAHYSGALEATAALGSRPDAARAAAERAVVAAAVAYNDGIGSIVGEAERLAALFDAVDVLHALEASA